jgi:arginyl-tRNA synthetase
MTGNKTKRKNTKKDGEKSTIYYLLECAKYRYNTVMKNEIEKYLRQAILEAKKSNDWPDFGMSELGIERPKNEQFGDYTTNIAMVLAKPLKKNPMEIAEAIRSQVLGSRYEVLEKVEVVAPGYINFYLSKKYFQDKIAEIVAKENNFGDSGIGDGIKVNNEFISANPTGPLHLGNGRGGFFGDSLSRVLRKAGFEVTNEFYVNDAGGQVEKLGHSVLKDDEAVYNGEYIEALNEKYAKTEDVREVGKKAAADILENIIKKTVKEKMQIEYDVWASEQKIKDDGYVERAIDSLKKEGFTYESEGALWLKTTEFGDDKDRVLIKSDGVNAYIAGDCGYMLYKIERSYGQLIMGLGADHHGYVSRLKAVAKALGFGGDFRIILSQLVRLVKDGKEVRMSKRAGNVVYIDDLIEKIGHDVTRFFFLMYSPDTHMNFDLGLAMERSQKNPVFYVQYAHARICSILQKAEAINNTQYTTDNKNANLALLVHEKESSLIRELEKFPELVEEVSNSYEVHKLPHYAIRLADKFHSFYDSCRVIDEENQELTKARLSLVQATKIVLKETLRLIGVQAPEKM